MSETHETSANDIARLVDGIHRFRIRHYKAGPGGMREFADHGPSPSVPIIAGSDSGINPAILTAAAPGEVFSVRNAANLVPPWQRRTSFNGTAAAAGDLWIAAPGRARLQPVV